MKRIIAAAVGLLVLLASSPVGAEDGVTDKEVVIGAGLDLTGAVANWGVNIKAGMEAMFNRANAAGGVHLSTTRAGHAIVRLTCSKRVCPACLPSATCGQVMSSA